MLDSLFPDEISYPLCADQSQLQLLRQKLNNALEKTRLVRKRELAKTLSAFHQPVEKLVRKVLDFDLGFSIACFSAKFQLRLPELTPEAGIGFTGGENLFLKARRGKQGCTFERSKLRGQDFPARAPRPMRNSWVYGLSGSCKKT